MTKPFLLSLWKTPLAAVSRDHPCVVGTEATVLEVLVPQLLRFICMDLVVTFAPWTDFRKEN